MSAGIGPARREHSRPSQDGLQGGLRLASQFSVDCRVKAYLMNHSSYGADRLTRLRDIMVALVLPVVLLAAPAIGTPDSFRISR
jgi:hypothetical protein